MHILFGGSFDPVHIGHLATAEAVRQQLCAETVTLLPAARSPLKNACTDDVHRLAMLRCALQDYPALRIDERELRRPPPSYTIDTLREIRHSMGEIEPLVWVMGSDALASLSQWKDWQALIRCAHLLVIERADTAWPTQCEANAWLANQPRATEVNPLQSRACGLWLRLSLPPQAFSSTAIRTQLQQRQSHTAPTEGLPACVWQYILEHNLYTHHWNVDTP